MQIDIGFGDVVYPESEESELPAMLDFPAPRLLCYSRESTRKTVTKLDCTENSVAQDSCRACTPLAKHRDRESPSSGIRPNQLIGVTAFSTMSPEKDVFLLSLTALVSPDIL